MINAGNCSCLGLGGVARSKNHSTGSDANAASINGVVNESALNIYLVHTRASPKAVNNESNAV